MPKFSLLLFSILVFSFSIHTQTEALPRWLIGTEVQLHFADIKYPSGTMGNYGFGIHVEKPIGRLSIGTGIMQQHFGWSQIQQYTGVFNPGTNDEPGTYEYYTQDQKTAFWNIPLRIQYRMPCNCVYLQGAIINSFLYSPVSYRRDGFINPLTQAPPEGGPVSGPAHFSVGYELGLGLNFHLSSKWKLYTRLLYTEYSFGGDARRTRKELGESYFGLNLGLQRAIY